MDSSTVNKSTETVVVTSFKELNKALKKASNKHIILESSKPEVWRLPTKEKSGNNGRKKTLYLDGVENCIIESRKYPITIYGHAMILSKCNNVTLRNLIIRMGAKGFRTRDVMKKDKSRFCYDETLSVDESKNILIENCSFSWSVDEVVTARESTNVVFLRCLIADPLNEPKDSKGEWLHYEKNPHAYGPLIRASTSVKFDQTAFVRCLQRNPSMSPKTTSEKAESLYVNNCIIYNYFNHGTQFNDGNDKDKKQEMYMEVTDNIYIAAPKIEGPGTIAKKHGPPIDIEVPSSNQLVVAYRDNYLLDPELSQAKPWVDESKEKSKNVTIKALDQASREAPETLKERLFFIMDQCGARPDGKLSNIDNAIISDIKEMKIISNTANLLSDETHSKGYKEDGLDLIP